MGELTGFRELGGAKGFDATDSGRLSGFRPPDFGHRAPRVRAMDVRGG